MITNVEKGRISFIQAFFECQTWKNTAIIFQGRWHIEANTLDFNIYLHVSAWNDGEKTFWASFKYFGSFLDVYKNDAQSETEFSKFST